MSSTYKLTYLRRGRGGQKKAVRELGVYVFFSVVETFFSQLSLTTLLRLVVSG